MNKIFTLGLGLLLGISVSLSIAMYVSLPKTGYIDTQQVFAGFGQTKDLEQKLNQVQALRAKLLDSLQLNMKVQYEDLRRQGNPGKQQIEMFEKVQEEYIAQEKYISEEAERLTQAYNDQIWKQLNQYIKEFGEQKNFQYIYGASGEGNLMYARASEDVTEEVLQFANERYQGK